MRTIFPLVFVLFAALVWGQNADSLAAAAQVDSLLKISRDLTAKKDFDQALAVNAAAEKIALEKLGNETKSYADCCFNHGRIVHLKGDLGQAEAWYLKARDLRKKLLEPTHPDLIRVYNNLGILYRSLNQFEKAEEHFLILVSLQENVSGKIHADYVTFLGRLAILYDQWGIYEKSEPLFLEITKTREQLHGKAHPEYCGSLINLGNVYLNKANYEKAEPLYQEARRLFETVLKDTKHPVYINCIANLARLFRETGNFLQAEPLSVQAQAVREKTLGRNHPDYAHGLSDLALLYVDLGNYDKAEELFLEAAALQRELFGEEHSDYAGTLSNLSRVYRHTGNCDLAASQAKKAVDLYAHTTGKTHPDYLPALHNLANAQACQGNLVEAVHFLSEAVQIAEGIYGKEHPKYCGNLIDLANLYEDIGNSDKAHALYIEARDIFENRLKNRQHRFYMIGLYNLATLYRNTGKYDAAAQLFDTLSALTRVSVGKSARHLSELELQRYIQYFESDQYQSFSLAGLMSAPGRDGAVINSACFNNILFYKGFLLHNVLQIRRLARQDSVSAELLNQLAFLQRTVASAYTKRPIDTINIKALEAQSEEVEKALMRTVAAYSAGMQMVDWRELRQRLRPEEALLEFIYYRPTDRKPDDRLFYAALLLVPNSPNPIFIPLFEQKQLDSLLDSKGDRRTDYVNHLYSFATRGVNPLDKPQKSLYDLLWKPLEPHLSGINTIYFSPSGMLHRLNLSAIPISMDSVLADRYHFIELGSTRQLVIPNAHKPAANDALLFGGIPYEADSTAMFQANDGLDSVAIASRGELSFAYTDSTLRTGAWGPLPFTDREVSSVEKTLKSAGFQSETRRGFAATEEAFKTIGAGGKPSPRILHLATHGFFFPDPTVSRQPSTVDREPVFKLSDHPMIRSGLLLAGGNHAWATGKPLHEGMEDGILTAYEISQMNLSNTELVVLSACETGLGDIQGNEGVYGLQRAFKIAGAKYLIMSLWQVPDKQTSLLMTTFYKKWLEEKMEIPEAFRDAQRELREAGLDPYQWAGFVLVE